MSHQLSLFDKPDERLDAFARLMKGSPLAKVRKPNWCFQTQKPNTNQPNKPSFPEARRRTPNRPAPMEAKPQERTMTSPTMQTTVPRRPSKKSGGSVTQTFITESPPVVQTAELERNTAAPLQLGDTLEAAVAAKLMEGVLEYFKDQVRGKLIAAGLNTGESEHGQVKLSAGGGPSRVVNYYKFLEACRARKMPVDVRNSLLSISKGALEAHFGENDIDAMCDDGPAATAACTIEQKKTLVTPIGVPGAMKILTDYFKKGIINDKTFLKKQSGKR